MSLVKIGGEAETRFELINLDRMIEAVEMLLELLCDQRKILEERIDSGAVREWVQ